MQRLFIFAAALTFLAASTAHAQVGGPGGSGGFAGGSSHQWGKVGADDFGSQWDQVKDDITYEDGPPPSSVLDLACGQWTMYVRYVEATDPEKESNGDNEADIDLTADGAHLDMSGYSWDNDVGEDVTVQVSIQVFRELTGYYSHDSEHGSCKGVVTGSFTIRIDGEVCLENDACEGVALGLMATEADFATPNYDLAELNDSMGNTETGEKFVMKLRYKQVPIQVDIPLHDDDETYKDGDSGSLGGSKVTNSFVIKKTSAVVGRVWSNALWGFAKVTICAEGDNTTDFLILSEQVAT